MEQYAPQLWLMTGALVLGLAAPFFAVLVLDGIVGLFRREGAGALGGAIVATIVVGGGGYALWRIGLDQTSALQASVAIVPDPRTLIVTLLVVTVPIALMSFVVRTVRSLRTRVDY